MDLGGELCRVLTSLAPQPKHPSRKRGLGVTARQELGQSQPIWVVAEMRAAAPCLSLMELLCPSPFVMDEFKRKYSNEDTLTVALPYFWEHFDKDGWSIWYSQYRFPEELSQTFMSCNLITGESPAPLPFLFRACPGSLNSTWGWSESQRVPAWGGAQQ